MTNSPDTVRSSDRSDFHDRRKLTSLSVVFAAKPQAEAVRENVANLVSNMSSADDYQIVDEGTLPSAT